MPFMFAIFVLSIVSIIGVYYLGINEIEISKYIPTAYIGIISFAFILVLIFLFFSVLWIWRRNKIVITDQHIVDIDQVGLFNRVVSTLRLEEIQDISASVKGPMQTIFQYGSIVIQTAGERANFLFDYVPNPYELEHYILETRKQYYDPDDEGVKS
ncbi:PH domain-containing protein [Candidatus Saccharibacteria bacterium]|nr:PH domain-containing protein [Candidatus Saccharibacteria bacterium]